MSKEKLIKLLIDDFKKMFPESGELEKRELFFKLSLLDEKDLELLVSQLEVSKNGN